MLPLESDEKEVKLNQNQIKILTPNKILIKLPVLLEHIKAGNNSHKLKT